MALLITLFLLFPAASPAQEAAPTAQPQPVFTLHVYNNLVQFPTLVLSNDMTPMPPVPREKFAITLDGGPVFHPTQMRREGTDPIALAVLLDVSGDQKELVDAFPAAFAQLVPAFLQANDRISFYAADCTLIRSLDHVPPEPDAVKKGFDKLLVAPTLHGAKQKPACGRSLHLWDYLSLVGHDLAQQPGRRVILLVSLGGDRSSTTTSAQAGRYLGSNGTAVFALQESAEFAQRPLYDGPSASGIGPLEAIVEKSGGLTFFTKPALLARHLQRLIMMLRERYIIEFPRADEGVAGHHGIAITIPGKAAFIRPTGASTPLPDPALLNDPNTLPTTASPARIGTRRPKD